MKNSKLLKHLRLLDVYFATICLTITALLTFANVIWRYILKSSIPWAQEVITLCFAWSIMIGMSSAYKYKMHYGVEFLVTKLKGIPRRIVYIMNYTVMTIGCSMMAYLSFIITREGFFKLTPYFQLPYSVKYVSAFIGFLLMAIYSVRYLYLVIFKPDQFLYAVSDQGHGLGVPLSFHDSTEV